MPLQRHVSSYILSIFVANCINAHRKYVEHDEDQDDNASISSYERKRLNNIKRNQRALKAILDKVNTYTLVLCQ